MLSRLSRDGGGRLSELVRLEHRAAAPPALDVTSIEDDARLNAIAGMSASFSEGRMTPHIGSTSAEGPASTPLPHAAMLVANPLQDPLSRSARTTLLWPTWWVRLVAARPRGCWLIRPQQADSDDAALVPQACVF
eukprot:s632_g5.t1